MHAIRRRMAIRVIRSYRTVGKRAVTLLAGIPPFEKLTEMHARTYRVAEELKRRGISGKGKEMAKVKIQERSKVIKDWKEELSTKDIYIVVGEPARQSYNEGMVRKERQKLTFHMTQMITGHGCFGTYLKRIGKEESSICVYCLTKDDDAQHTMEECAYWIRERIELEETLGKDDLSLKSVMKEIVDDQEKWNGFQEFCGKIIKKKEEDERIRRGEAESGSSDRSDNEKEEDGNDTGRRRLRRMKIKLKRIRKRKKKRWKLPAHLQGK